MALAINSQKVYDGPRSLNSTGVNCDMSITPTHSTITHMDMATPRTFVGKISEMITQGIGPNDDAKQATNPNIKMSSHGP